MASCELKTSVSHSLELLASLLSEDRPWQCSARHPRGRHSLSSPLLVPHPSAPEQEATAVRSVGCGALRGLHARLQGKCGFRRSRAGPKRQGLSLPAGTDPSAPGCPSGTIHIADGTERVRGSRSRTTLPPALGDANTGPMIPMRQLKHVTSFTLVPGIQFSNVTQFSKLSQNAGTAKTRNADPSLLLLAPSCLGVWGSFLKP